MVTVACACPRVDPFDCLDFRHGHDLRVIFDGAYRADLNSGNQCECACHACDEDDEDDEDDGPKTNGEQPAMSGHARQRRLDPKQKTCSQCGKAFRARACGPTHAAIQAYRHTARKRERP